jgi:hypothetical protein
MEYGIWIEARERYAGEVTIEADSEEEALQKAREMTRENSPEDLNLDYQQVDWFVDNQLVVASDFDRSGGKDE